MPREEFKQSAQVKGSVDFLNVVAYELFPES